MNNKYMTIDDMINAVIQFELNNGVEPNKIFLGRIEIIIIEEKYHSEKNKNCAKFIKITRKEEEKQYLFDDIEVVQVNKDEFFYLAADDKTIVKTQDKELLIDVERKMKKIVNLQQDINKKLSDKHYFKD